MSNDEESCGSKNSMGRRLSWADQAPPLSARPVAEEIPIPPEDRPQDAVDIPGETRLHLGILRQGDAYGLFAPLPHGAVAAEVQTPLPPGLNADVQADEHGCLMLWLEYFVKDAGRHHDSFVVSVTGAEFPQWTVHIEANIMAPGDGRPSKTHDDVKLLRRASKEVVAATAEGTEWRRAAQAAREDEDDGSP